MLTPSEQFEFGAQAGHTLTSMFGEQTKVLVVGNGCGSLAGLKRRLSGKGLTIMTAKGEEKLRATHASFRSDVILLAPASDTDYGCQVCERTRAADPSVAIIMLSDHSSEEHEVWGLDAGADDYLTRPFSTEVLLARIRANVRGRWDAAGKRQIIEAGDLWLDARNYVVRAKDEGIILRPQEFRILAVLALSRGEPLNSKELSQRIPGQWRGDPNRTVKTNIHRIRSAIEPSSDYTYIHTVKKVGYQFRPVPKKLSSQFRRD